MLLVIHPGPKHSCGKRLIQRKYDIKEQAVETQEAAVRLEIVEHLHVQKHFFEILQFALFIRGHIVEAIDKPDVHLAGKPPKS